MRSKAEWETLILRMLAPHQGQQGGRDAVDALRDELTAAGLHGLSLDYDHGRAERHPITLAGIAPIDPAGLGQAFTARVADEGVSLVWDDEREAPATARPR
jgi:hypothetical protein